MKRGIIINFISYSTSIIDVVSIVVLQFHLFYAPYALVGSVYFLYTFATFSRTSSSNLMSYALISSLSCSRVVAPMIVDATCSR